MNLQSLKNKVETQQEIIATPSQQLEMISQIRAVEYQNSLVLTSLEQYNTRHEQLKHEQTALLGEIQQKIHELKDSNKTLTANIGQEIESLSASVDALYGTKVHELNQLTEEYIRQMAQLQKDSSVHLNSYLNRRKILDVLVYINLAITPFLVAYILFFLRK